MGVSEWDDVSRNKWSRYDLELSPQGHIHRVFDMFSRPAHNVFLVLHKLTIFGTLVYRHEMMWHVYSYSRFDVDLWRQGQIYILSCLHVRNFCQLWQCHTIFGTWVYHHERMCQVNSWFCIDTTLIFDHKVKGFMTLLCVQASDFWSFDIVLCLAHECITMVRCVAYIHELCMTLVFDLNIKIIFSTWIWVWLNVFSLWYRHAKFCHMGVWPWDNMFCTFFNLVWPWPLTNIWVTGISKSKFTMMRIIIKEYMYRFSFILRDNIYKSVLIK